MTIVELLSGQPHQLSQRKLHLQIDVRIKMEAG